MRSTDRERLVLEPLGDNAWRLCDRAIASCDADNVLAYVEQGADGRYEVTWGARAIGTATFATMGDLLREAAGLLIGTRSRTVKPLPIPHRPPMRAS
nr:hypothetical protein [Microbacterium aquimaris]